MLGYVQEKSTDELSVELAQELSHNSIKHRVADGGELEAFSAAQAMPAFRSTHSDTKGKPLLVIHELLPFAA